MIGISAIGIADDARHYCARTRAVVRTVAAPTWGGGLVSTIRSLADELEAPPVLFPCRDPSVDTVSGHRHDLGDVRVLLPSHEVVRALADKGSFAQVARSSGLRIPRTWIVAPEGGTAALLSEVRYPAVVKPTARSDAWDRSGEPKGYIVHDPDAIRRALTSISGLAPSAVVQEWIPGPVQAHLTCNLLLGGGWRGPRHVRQPQDPSVAARDGCRLDG